MKLNENTNVDQSPRKSDKISTNKSPEKVSRLQNIVKLDFDSKLWIELKVKEKNIMKRNYHATFTYKNKYILMKFYF